jgi:purine-binding chemotaxis protein CheW
MGNLVTTGNTAVAATAAEDNQQYLTFMLGGEVFAIGILSIKEIIEYGHLTTVPLMPEHIRGVINLRGAVVPVIDLSARFGRSGTQATRRTCIVIIEVRGDDTGGGGGSGGQQDIGVVVDAVNEVVEIPAAQIEPAPAFGARIRTDFIQGMGKVNERFVIILSVDHVLSVEELAALEQLHANSSGGAAGAG